jgi:two-component system OmpR family sensor kinase
VLATTGTAIAAVLLAAILGFGLTRTAYDASARTVLHREALLIARLADSPAGRPGRPLRTALRNSRIRVIRVPADGVVNTRSLLAGTSPAAVRLRDAAAAGRSTQQTLVVAGQRYLTDTEPVPAGGGVVLVQRLADARAVGNSAAHDLLWAAALGLLVAIALGVGLSRRLTRPLVRAAAAARELAAGRRDIRLDTGGPAEVAAVSTSLNTIAETLARTEARERDFLVSVSHELRTPLTAIRGFGEAIADGVTTGDEAVAAGATILAEAERMTHLVSDLLELARSGTSDFRVAVTDVDLGALLADAAAAWTDRAGARGLRILLDPPASTIRLATDGLRVRQIVDALVDRQIVDALVDNAVRVTPPGGVVALGLRRAGAAPDTVDAVDAAILSVRDSGPGLAPADYPVAFQRGVLHERYRGIRPGGSGVGLALVGNLASRLGGWAVAGPAPEGGAAFTIHLARLPPGPSGPAPRRTGRRENES